MVTLTTSVNKSKTEWIEYELDTIHYHQIVMLVAYLHSSVAQVK